MVRVARGRGADSRNVPQEEDENGKYKLDSLCCIAAKNVPGD